MLVPFSLGVVVTLVLQYVLRPQPAPCFLVETLDRRLASQLAPSEVARQAGIYFERAAKQPGQYQGLLNLLSAHDLEPLNLDLVWNVVEQYVKNDYPDLALSELERLLRMEIEDSAVRAEIETYKADLIAKNPGLLETVARRRQQLTRFALPKPTNLLPFSTLVQTYDLSAIVSADDNQRLYDATIDFYEQMKVAMGEQASRKSMTQLNHDFFKWQIAELDRTGDYWRGFVDLPLFEKLTGLMRQATVRFLVFHGYSELEATEKATHNLIFWLSVHDVRSEHQPHVTNDALAGGVYYVSLSPNPQHLTLFDSRGKPPVQMSEANAKTLPLAPFHRTVDIVPAESLLVIFPGYLVHSVSPLNRTFDDVPPAQQAGGRPRFRVSLSLNQKGEWLNSAGLTISMREPMP
jgi:hypothetical protein